MRTTMVAALLVTLAGPALAQLTPQAAGGGTTNGASSAIGTAPTGSFAPAARAAGAGAPVPYTGTATATPGHTAGTPPAPTTGGTGATGARGQSGRAATTP